MPTLEGIIKAVVRQYVPILGSISDIADTNLKRQVVSATVGQLRSALPQFPSGRSILRSLRAEGIKIGNEQFYNIYRRARDYDTHETALTLYPSDKQVPEDLVLPGTPFQQRKYNYTFSVNLQTYQKGWERKPIRLSSSRLMSKNTAIRKFREQHGAKFEEVGNIDWDSMELHSVTRRTIEDL
jgi:hypothetical protein